MKILEQYLRENHEKGVIDHVIRAQVNNDGWVSFYIHPHGIDGETLDFDVNDNQLFGAQIAQPDGTYLIAHGYERRVTNRD